MAQNALCSCCCFAHLYKVILTEQVEFVVVSDQIKYGEVWGSKVISRIRMG